MEFLLVFPLMLAFFFTGQSCIYVIGQTSDSCYALCPAGYHSTGHCNDDDREKHRCERCTGPTYTDVENSRTRCMRCGRCDNNRREIRPCLYNQNVLCDCEEGFYNNSTVPHTIKCLKCPCKSCKGPDDNKDYITKCKSCQSNECLKDPESKRKCTTSPTPSRSSYISTSTSTSITITSSSAGTPPRHDSVILKVLLFLLSCVVVYWLWLLFFRHRNGSVEDVEVPVKAPKFSEQCSLRGSTATTLTLNISEGTPMMNLSPSTAPDHPAQYSPLLPEAEYKAARLDEQSERWPAIVLYAIIKEVPLRRWKEFLRLLSVADQQLERVELETGLGQGSVERQYQMLRLWSQRPSASMDEVFSALHHMDLSGCAQLLQESLEKLQGRPEVMQGFAA